MGDRLPSFVGGLFTSWPCAVMYSDRAGTIVWSNARAQQLFEATPGDLIDQPIQRVLHLTAGDTLTSALDAASFCTKAMALSGHTFAVEVYRTLIDDGWLWEVRDYTISYQAEGKFRALVEVAPDAMVMIDRRGRILLLNTAAEALFGYSRQELIGASIANMFPAHVDMIMPPSRDAAQCVPLRKFDSFLRHKSGHEFFVEICISNFEAGGEWRSLVAIRDISQRKALEDKLTQLANYDSLTGLANRNLFLQMLDHALATAHRARGCFALLFVDLNGFKSVNDTFGHDIGDILLRLTGERLRAAVREADTIARLGGDEFTIIVEGLNGPGDVAAIAHKILSHLCERATLLKATIVPCAAIGVAIYPDHATTAKDLLREADQAMYRAKTVGCPAFAFSNGEIVSTGHSIDQNHSLVS